MILVTGGTGLVGSRVVQALLANQEQVRVLVRGLSDWKDSSMPQFRRTGVDIISADIRDPVQVESALAGCKAVIHLASTLYSDPDFSVESVNAEATQQLVQLAEKLGVQRFVHGSCLGVIRYSGCRYFTSKFHAEESVKASKTYWTIFRPSLIFGEEAHMMDMLYYWIELLPFIPVVGSGLNMLQPVSADDVAASIVQSIYNKQTVYQTYPLVGPRQYPLTEVLDMVSRNLGHKKPLIKVPTGLALGLASLLYKLNPSCPVDDDVLKIFCTELSADAEIVKQTFELKGIPFESSLKWLDKPQQA